MISEIVKITKGQLVSTREDDVQIRELLIDSRQQKESENCLFIALKTAKNNGHKYIEYLYQLGFRHFLVEEIPSTMQQAKDTDFIIVPNTLKALQTIAMRHREEFNIPVLAITGSNGKTIVKEWIAMLLETEQNIVKSPKSYNSQIGVPLSVWQMNGLHTLAIFEAGISQPEEMENLEKIIHPTMGIFTNIGSAHDEYFLNETQKIAEKLKLFTEVDLLIYCADHYEIRDKILHIDTLKQTPSFTWSMESNVEADIKVLDIVRNSNSTRVNIEVRGAERMEMEIPFTDKASIENVMQCITFLIANKYSLAWIAKRLSVLHAVEMRMEMKEGLNHCYIINDFYNSDYNSLEIALDFLAHQHQNAKRRLILSDMLQSGRSEDELYMDIANLLEKKKIDSLIGIGQAMIRQADKFKIEASFYSSTEDFLSQIDCDAFQRETILLKGARIFEFEKISVFLQKRTHDTVMEININALSHNLNFFKSQIKPDTRIMVMGKAFSYGSGSYEIANFLQFNQCDYITVAYTDEGILLRKNGITIPIMVMNPDEQGLEKMLHYNLEPEIYSFTLLNYLRKSIVAKKSADDVTYIHLKIDTGMHRLGFMEDEIDLLIDEIRKSPFCKIRSIFTHLATADEPSMDTYTLAQLALFDKISRKIQDAIPYPILRHALNTAGILRFPQYQFDMVRLGIGLYGVGVTAEMQPHLENVSTLKTIISQVRYLPTGEAIGYGRSYICKSPMKIGVIPIGYADGLSRALSNGVGEVMVNGKRVPIIGNICMDMCMIDLSTVNANEKDEVILFGKEMPITEMAQKLHTIPYEILTGISPRVKRIYFQE
ncbi:MAG: bifunctional UDP-N-acetylmuramoyl-tripeptide:D-alanyl-D-alanine ligase/alanine racemase [Bacteroidales bacterium]